MSDSEDNGAAPSSGTPNPSVGATKTSSSPTGRPPKPVPFGYEYATPTASAGSGAAEGTDGGDADRSSSCPRRGLQAEVQRRRSSLSRGEVAFLEGLCRHGSETDLLRAHRRLQDALLFPDLNSGSADDGGDLMAATDSGSWKETSIMISEASFSECIEYGRERSADTVNAQATPAPVAPAALLGSQHTSTSSLGSERRLQSLEARRRDAEVFEGLWRSHRTGLCLSTGASRRNLLERQASSTRLGPRAAVAATADAIFRSRRQSLSRTSPMKETQSENRRLQSRRLLFRRSQTLGTAPQGRRASSSNLIGGRPKPVLRRQQSDFSHKSVTFGELPPKRDDEEALESGFLNFIKKTPLPPRRSDSVSSIPSLHKAHRIGSMGSASARSISSIPSIHLAHHVHSPSSQSVLSSTSGLPQLASVRSLSSIPSLHLAHHIYSRSQSFRSAASAVPDWEKEDLEKDTEEKKAAELADSLSLRDSKDTKELKPEDRLTSADFSRPVLVSDANGHEEEGVEVADFEIFALHDRYPGPLSLDSARRLDSLVSFGGTGADSSVVTSASFDETMSHGRISDVFRRSHLTRTLSDEDLTGVYLGGVRHFLRESSSVKEVDPVEDDVSWVDSEIDEMDYYDPWKVIEDEYVNGYGGGGTLPFAILGTYAEDVDSQPHVLSPPLMESLQEFLPFNIMGQNFWMKYSLVRDGASMVALLKAARGAKYSILAIETVDGEVFGCFTSQPWRKNWNYFGGSDSFLWRMQHGRKEKTKSIIEQAQMESEIEVYPYTGANDHIQLCLHDKIAVGGLSDLPKHKENAPVPTTLKEIKDHEWGFGFTIEKDCLTGTTSPCITFMSPSLSHVHADGSLFEIMNMELWTLTPCMTVEDAEKLELGKLFLEEHAHH